MNKPDRIKLADQIDQEAQTAANVANWSMVEIFNGTAAATPEGQRILALRSQAAKLRCGPLVRAGKRLMYCVQYGWISSILVGIASLASIALFLFMVGSLAAGIGGH